MAKKKLGWSMFLQGITAAVLGGAATAVADYGTIVLSNAGAFSV